MTQKNPTTPDEQRRNTRVGCLAMILLPVVIVALLFLVPAIIGTWRWALG